MQIATNMFNLSDIIESDEIDKDTVDEATLEQQFNKHYKLLTEQAVSLETSYINKLHCTKSVNSLAVTLSDYSIEVYNFTESSLSKTCKLSGHNDTVTDVVFSPQEDHILYSSSEDGVVKLWDIRKSGTAAQEYRDLQSRKIRPYLSMDVSCNGRVICAGSQLVQDDAFLVFWDQRNTAALGGYWNSHMDDITQVKFHKEKSEILATGAVDGLLNMFNIMEETEDDALLYSFNIENSVERLSWLDDKQIACVTQCSDLQIWDSHSGSIIKSLDREKISKGIRRSKPDDCYVVDVYKTMDNSSVILAGSNSGNGDCLRSVILAEKRLQQCSNFKENKQTVRCCHYNNEKDLLIMTGESGIISVWRLQDALQDSDEACKLTTPRTKSNVNRYTPY